MSNDSDLIRATASRSDSRACARLDFPATTPTRTRAASLARLRRSHDGRRRTPGEGSSLETPLRALDSALALHTGALETEEPTLACRPSIAAVVALLADKRTPWATKEATTRALVREHRRSGTSLFGAALLVAYAPLLVSIRGRLHGAPFERGDLDQILVDAFLVAVVRFDDATQPDRVVMHLHQNTRRAVFDLLNRERQHRDLGDTLVRFPDADIFSVPAHRSRLGAEEAEELAELLRAYVRDDIEPRRLDVVIDTYLRGLPLRGTVTDPRALAGALRERSRTIAMLRELLASRMVRPCVEAAWLRGVVP
jgi:hypothetical protein